jgi:hypothetical protein
MSGDTDHPVPCAAIADELAELALGTLTGRERSDALEHVGWCQRCRIELEQLSFVADALQQLAPQLQPPLGFELQLADRLQSATAPRPRPLRRLAALGVAATLVLVLAAGIVAVVARRSADGDSARAHVVTANFTSAGRDVGSVVISAGTPAWMLVTVSDAGWQGPVTCTVTLSSGTVATLGTFQVSGEYSAWATPLPATGDRVRAAQLIDAAGAVVATAQVRS